MHVENLENSWCMKENLTTQKLWGLETAKYVILMTLIDKIYLLYVHVIKDTMMTGLYANVKFFLF